MPYFMVPRYYEVVDELPADTNPQNPKGSSPAIGDQSRHLGLPQCRHRRDASGLKQEETT